MMVMDNKESAAKQPPPYLLGLLCFISLVGAFVGLGLLLYGIIKYKDKWLIAIGAFGILFTIAVYSSLFYSMKNASVFQDGFAQISQMQLNSLVQNIEFYKLQSGRYPDRLEQLQVYHQLAPIHDAIQSSQMRENANYIYERVGEQYLLFSSGLDGIANTADDLYPQVTLTDSTKLGLIIKK